MVMLSFQCSINNVVDKWIWIPRIGIYPPMWYHAVIQTALSILTMPAMKLQLPFLNVYPLIHPLCQHKKKRKRLRMIIRREHVYYLDKTIIIVQINLQVQT